MNQGPSEDLRELFQNGNRTRLSAMPSLPFAAALLPALYVLLCMSYLAVPGSQPFAAARQPVSLPNHISTPCRPPPASSACHSAKGQ